MQNKQEAQLLKFFRKITSRSDQEFILNLTERTAADQVQVRPSLRLILGASKDSDAGDLFRKNR